MIDPAVKEQILSELDRLLNPTQFRDRWHRLRRRGLIRNAQSPGRPEYPALLGQIVACQGRSREADGVSRPLAGHDLA